MKLSKVDIKNRRAKFDFEIIDFHCRHCAHGYGNKVDTSGKSRIDRFFLL